MSRAPDAVQQALAEIAKQHNLNLSLVLLEQQSNLSLPPSQPPIVLIVNPLDSQRTRQYVSNTIPTSEQPIQTTPSLPVTPAPSAVATGAAATATASKRPSPPSFHLSTDDTSLPIKRPRSNPRPLSMPSLRTHSSSPTPSIHVPYWGTVLTGSTSSTTLPPPPPPVQNPRDDPRFFSLLKGELVKKLTATSAPGSASVIRAKAPPTEPSPLVAQIRSHAVTPPTARYATPTSPYNPPGLPFGAGGAARPSSMPSLPRLGPSPALPPIRLPTVGYVDSSRTGVAQQPPTSSTTTTGNVPSGPGPSAATGTQSSGQYSCHLCEANFKRRSDMNRHVRVVHEKQRPFQCPQCLQRFGEKSNMQKHVRMVHQNIRGFHCNHCGAKFGQRGNCEAHVRAVHEKRPGKYECEQCSKAFTRKSHLLDHYHAEHPSIPPPTARAKPRSSSVGSIAKVVVQTTTPFAATKAMPLSATSAMPLSATTAYEGATISPLAGSLFQRSRLFPPPGPHTPHLPPPPPPPHRTRPRPIELQPPPRAPQPPRTPPWRGGSSAGDAAARRKRDAEEDKTAPVTSDSTTRQQRGGN